MNFQTAVKTCFQNYVTFSGRASRSEYWYFVLFGFLVGLILGFILGFLEASVHIDLGFLAYIFDLSILLPSIAVGVRRLHDIDKSGWWYLLVILPLVGSIILLVWFCTRGDDEPNRFGGNPLAIV